jgi:hypothetical protein
MFKMTKIAAIAGIASTVTMPGLSRADIIAQGLELATQKAPVSLVLTDADRHQDLVTLRVSADNAIDMKGYGFIVSFDPDRFEYVGVKESSESIISPNGTDALLVAKNHEPGRVAVGAVQVDGSSASGEGDLVDLTFRSLDPTALADFRLTEAVVVNLAGQASSVASSVLDNVGVGPSEYGLLQNIPNPFNPETTIAYQVRESGKVQLVIYTSIGQEVRTLVDEVKEGGQYTVRWDGRDPFGRQVASGVYFYRMRADGFSDTKRMMLLK